MKYYTCLVFLFVFLYSCATPITSPDQVDIRNYDMLMQVKDGSYEGYPITEEDILEFGVKKQVQLDTLNNIQIVKYINDLTGHIESEYLFYRKNNIRKNITLELGTYTDLSCNLEQYIDSISHYFYDSTNIRDYYKVARPYAPSWQNIKSLQWSQTKKVGEYAPMYNYRYNDSDKDSTIEKIEIKGYCDFSEVLSKVVRESTEAKDRKSQRNYLCKIFIDPTGDFYQMYYSKKDDIDDIKLIMDCLTSFDYSNFLSCMDKEDIGFEVNLPFLLRAKLNITPPAYFAVPKKNEK